MLVLNLKTGCFSIQAFQRSAFQCRF